MDNIQSMCTGKEISSTVILIFLFSEIVGAHVGTLETNIQFIIRW